MMPIASSARGPTAMVWGKAGNPFAVLPFPVAGSMARPVDPPLRRQRQESCSACALRPSSISSTIRGRRDRDRQGLGASGWRAITKPGQAGAGYEFAVFQGGTYFRAVGEGQFYGVSARALAIGPARLLAKNFPLPISGSLNPIPAPTA